jgi:TRAP-type C4-dicarboxylate transport system permease small subunit
MKVLKWLDIHVEEYLMVIFLAAMSIIIFVQVIARYIFNDSLSWSEEIARYLFIWLTYPAISYGVKVNGHIRVDAFLLVLPKPLKKLWRILSNLLFLTFSCLVVWFGVEVSGKIMMSGQQTPAVGLPMWFVYAAVPFGFLLTTFRLVRDTINKFKDIDADEGGGGIV